MSRMRKSIMLSKCFSRKRQGELLWNVHDSSATKSRTGCYAVSDMLQYDLCMCSMIDHF